MQFLKQNSICLSLGRQGLTNAHTSSLPGSFRVCTQGLLRPCISVSKQRLRLGDQDLGGEKHVSVVVREPHYKKVSQHRS